MSAASEPSRPTETSVVVRYWAGARAAAGTGEDVIDVAGTTTLAALLDVVRDLHPGEKMARTVGVCSVLIGDQPVGSRDPGSVVVEAGSVVELLPPFAGG